ncbi:hypothetical protein [Streptomyces sp. MMS20-AI2-20]|uniref:hypothetical protein n=1 Tax=Streptomyces sp. MMS20-AI2-20 TaxID=2925835 RepID=UPI001F608C70|nr:hypothetical protein [Streptomyces sp. MMS20-AI2-20]MCI4143052.1 hypothetical protein [Streptomyces sp. MMS20-AI2-20]
MGKAFVAKLAKEGARDPEALAAWIGRKKHGKAAFAKLAAKGRKSDDKPSTPRRAATPAAPPRRRAATRSKPFTQSEEQKIDNGAFDLARLPEAEFARMEQKYGDPSVAESREDMLRAEAVKRARARRERAARERAAAENKIAAADPGLSGKELERHVRKLSNAQLRELYLANSLLNFRGGEFARAAGVEYNARRTRGHL